MQQFTGDWIQSPIRLTGMPQASVSCIPQEFYYRRALKSEKKIKCTFIYAGDECFSTSFTFDGISLKCDENLDITGSFNESADQIDWLKGVEYFTTWKRPYAIQTDRKGK